MSVVVSRVHSVFSRLWTRPAILRARLANLLFLSFRLARADISGRLFLLCNQLSALRVHEIDINKGVPDRRSKNIRWILEHDSFKFYLIARDNNSGRNPRSEPTLLAVILI